LVDSFRGVQEQSLFPEFHNQVERSHVVLSLERLAGRLQPYAFAGADNQYPHVPISSFSLAYGDLDQIKTNGPGQIDVKRARWARNGWPSHRSIRVLPTSTPIRVRHHGGEPMCGRTPEVSSRRP
jgi:hypothetical protein